MNGNTYMVSCRVKLVTDVDAHQGVIGTELRRHHIEKGSVGVVVARTSDKISKPLVRFDGAPSVAIFVPDEWLQGE